MGNQVTVRKGETQAQAEARTIKEAKDAEAARRSDGEEKGVLRSLFSIKIIDEEAWLNIFGKFKHLDPKFAYRQELYYRYYTADTDQNSPHHRSFFNSIDRIKLTISIIEADQNLGGAELCTSTLPSLSSLFFFFLNFRF